MVIMNFTITIAAICVGLNHCHKDVSKVSKIIKNTLYVSQCNGLVITSTTKT